MIDEKIEQEQVKEVVEKEEVKGTDDSKKIFGVKIPDIIAKTIDKIRGAKKDVESEPDTVISKDADDTLSEDVKDKPESKEVESPEPKSSDDEFIEEEIPSHLVTAARRLGWSDATIVKLAETDISVLEDIARKSEPEKEVKEDKPIDVPLITLDDEVVKKYRQDYGDDLVDKIIKPLVDAQNASNKRLNEMQGSVVNQQRQSVVDEQVRVFNQFNEILDKASTEYSEFGKVETMPKGANGVPSNTSPEFKVRSKVYEVAMMFLKNGYPVDKAIQEAVTWYGGTQGSKRAERTLVTEINDRKKKFSAKPTNKQVQKTFRNVEEHKSSIVQEAMKTAGIV